ncbi:uncharacterized protein DFL_008398 [Arthrobotrys flagrans]|uniref:Uncharacterized protein n=1 Tax=Arthrobotrys flagrans TaxID=97331 RepID=A0A436ZNL8_ARTFL|nr:hypothetical protein DFL_008398 [Arthrobotrys flagrans]
MNPLRTNLAESCRDRLLLSKWVSRLYIYNTHRQRVEIRHFNIAPLSSALVQIVCREAEFWPGWIALLDVEGALENRPSQTIVYISI